MSKTKNVRMYTDHRGNDIPSNFIHKLDRQKHSTAVKYCNKAKRLAEQLAKFKADLIAECDALYEQSLKDNMITVRKNAKGGYSISTIDKKYQITVSVSESIKFDDNIDLAQELIAQYLNEVTEGIDHGLKTLVNEAFKTRRGQLDTKRVLGLLKLEIKHKTWVRAMELVRKAISVDGRKRYITLSEKDEEGKDVNIKLEFSSI